MKVHCPFGLGNRVAAMANGLSMAKWIRFIWPVNHHCPARAEEVFPHGVPGVEFLEAPRGRKQLTRWNGLIAHCWDATNHRTEADLSYATIMDAMVGDAVPLPPSVAVIGRFHRNPAGCPHDLARRAAKAASETQDRRVFVLSDCHRGVIIKELQSAGAMVIPPQCPALPNDLKRSSATLLKYIIDWKTALCANKIIALDGPSSALHPARAAGKRIDYGTMASVALR